MAETWEQEKERRKRASIKNQEYVNQLAGYLASLGIDPATAGVSIHGKMDAMLEMLVEAGIVTERHIMDMEEKYAEQVIGRLTNTIEQVKTQAIKQGVALPPVPTRSGLIVGG